MSRAARAVTRPGALRVRAVLESRTEMPDGAGGTTPVWTVDANIWVNVMPVKAKSVSPAEGRREAITHRVTLRRRSGVTLNKRFRTEDRVLEIRTVHDPDERGVWLICECEDVQ